MRDDIVINKVETIRRCLGRINEEYIGFEEELASNYTKQDSIVLNLERASQASIDLAVHVVRIRQLGVPKTSREIFELLQEHRLIDEKTAHQMKKMVGFRNIAVHDYQTISLDIICSIIEQHLDDFRQFIDEIIAIKN